MKNAMVLPQTVSLALILSAVAFFLTICPGDANAKGRIREVSRGKFSSSPSQQPTVGGSPQFAVGGNAAEVDAFKMRLDRGVYDVTLKGDKGQLPGTFQDRLSIMNTYTFFDIGTSGKRYCIATHYYYLENGNKSRPVFSGEVKNRSPLYKQTILGYSSDSPNEGSGKSIFAISEVLKGYDKDVDEKIKTGDATNDDRTVTLTIDTDDTVVWVYTRYAEGWHRAGVESGKLHVISIGVDNNRGAVFADGVPNKDSISSDGEKGSFVIDDNSNDKPKQWERKLSTPLLPVRIHGLELTQPATKFSLKFEISSK